MVEQIPVHFDSSHRPTDPVAVINGGNNIVRGFGESFTVASSSTDNFGIDRKSGGADGSFIRSDLNRKSFTYV